MIAALAAPPDFPIGGRALRDVLIDGVSLGAAPDMLFSLFSYITGGERRQKAKALAAGEDPDGDAQTLDVLAAIHKFAGARPDPEAFVEALDPLQPRALFHRLLAPDRRQAHCAVRRRGALPDRGRTGSASPPLLGGRVRAGDKVKIYVQKAQHFGLPPDPSLPIIMIGPGTGIAPFRAFLYERMASKAPGATGCSSATSAAITISSTRTSCRHEGGGRRARLSLAWSRDGAEKFYVQDRMREVGRELWAF